MDKRNHKADKIKSIFIVDDAEWHNVLLKTLLSQSGYEVKAFTDGYMLLENLKKEPPHLIISDIDMPEIDGLELCKLIKDTPEGSEIPVMLLSSLKEEDVKDEADKNGAVGFMQKPFEKQPLLDVVAQRL